MKKTVFLILLFINVGWAMSQTRISGTVVDENGDLIIGASVQVKGTQIGSATDVDGNFSILVPEDGRIFLISYIGMITKEVAIQPDLRIVLVSDTKILEELVVVAYGQQKKEAITGAVATVKSENLTKRPIATATAALEGQALGVQVNNSYGEPGASPQIRIRGFGSITGSNSPLYVVDGVPMGGAVNDINPNDIESISVLKDASSAALYGNRAANGVILIQTKSGRLGQERINLTVDVKQGIFERGMKEYETMNPKEFMEAQWQSRRNSAYTDAKPGKYTTWSDANADALALVMSDVGVNYNIFNKKWEDLYDANGKLVPDAEIRPEYRDDLDWFKDLERNGWRQEYNINATGGSSRSKYFLSVGYLDEEGFIKFSSGKRFTGRSNITVSPTQWLSVGLNLTGSHHKYSGVSTSSATSYVNPFFFSRNMAPIYPVHLHHPDSAHYILDENKQKIYDGGEENARPQYSNRHVIWEYELNKDETLRTTLEGTFFAEITFLRDFKFRVNASSNRVYTMTQSYNNATIGDGKGKGRMSEDSYRYTNETFQELLTWKRSFDDRHNFEILLGHENYSWNYRKSYLYKQDEKLKGLIDLSNLSTNSTISGGGQDYRTEGYLSRAAYNYDDKYFGEFSFRRDASSRFHKDNRWGNFWSLGGSWQLSHEDFIKQYSWINNLKLRAAYGEVGQDVGVGLYGYMNLYLSTQNGGNAAFYKTQNEAPDISWEKSQSMSVALETHLFNRLNLTIEYFDKRSKDLLFKLNLPSSMGGNDTQSTTPKQVLNFGSLSNRGLEIGVNLDLMKTKDFKWAVGANTTLLKNKILSMPDEFGGEGYISGLNKRIEGRSIYDFWLYQFEGVERSSGRSLYRLNDEAFQIDETAYNGTGATTGDGDERTVMKNTDYTIIEGEAYVYKTTYAKQDWGGSAIPKAYGSLNTSVRYKNFNFSALCTYQLGGLMIDRSYNALLSTGTSPSAMHKDLLKSWTPEQAGEGIDKTGIPALNTTQNGDNNSMSNRHLISSDYFAIKNISLSYSLPKNWLKQIDVNEITLSAAVENLAIFTKRQGMNPQQNFRGDATNTYMPARMAILGLNVKF